MTYQIVCEGACNNGAVEYADRLLREAPRTPDGSPIMTDYELSILRGLKHTEHAMLGSATARCLSCGATRRYGWA